MGKKKNNTLTQDKYKPYLVNEDTRYRTHTVCMVQNDTGLRVHKYV